MDSFKWIWGYMKKYKYRIFFAFILVLACSLTSMVVPYFSGVVVDQVILGGNTQILLPIIGIMIAVTLARSVGRYSFQIILEYVSQNVIFEIREITYKRLQELDFDFFDNNRTGDIMARMTGDVEAVRHFVAWVTYMVFENLAILVFAVSFMFCVNVKLTLLLLCITPITGCLAYKMTSEVRPTFAAIREQFSRLNSVVQENISGNRVVKAFANEDYEIEKFSKENVAYKQRNLESSAIWEKYLPVLDSLAGVLVVIMILAGGIMVIHGSMTMGELVSFNSFIWALNNPMRMVGWLINDIQRFNASAVKIIALMNTRPKIRNSKNSIKKDRIKGRVEFKNVSFSYKDEQVLKNVSFSACPGQTIAIIGPTGSGKSTLISLICRFYDCTDGEILIDGINIKDMDIRKLRQNISVAMQDIFLFSDTIEGNIAYGVPHATMQQVEQVAMAAGAHDFIVSLPEGYDTIVGERGVGLSGGQKQRIALARALLKNPSILILDDTTSSVDMETEHAIYKSLKSFYKDKTTFIIAHRISSVKDADLILVLENGSIVEQGTHNELIQKKGYYYSVFINQFGDFDNLSVKEVG